MRRKWMMIGMAGILAAGLLAGCSGGENSEGSGKSASPETDSAQAVSGSSGDAKDSSGDSGDGAGEEVEAQSITVSAAASLTDVLNELAETYKEADPGMEISFTFGGSGALQAQIEEGAPVDLFFSAAEDNMDALEEGGLIDAETRRNILKNEIVLIAPQGGTEVSSFETILDSEPQIALGEAESVPAGKYAQQIFENLGIWEGVQSHAVFASNVREVLSWVEAGEADCGVVYATDAMTSDAVQVICSAPEDGPQVLYPAAVIKDCANPEGAEKFLEFLTGDEAKAAFESYGFTVLE